LGLVWLLNNFYDKFIFTNGLKFKEHNFFLMDLPFIICPAQLLTCLLETGDIDFERKLYNAIKESTSRHLIPLFGAEFGLRGEKMLDFLEKYFIASGWGLLKNIDLDFKAKKAIVSVSSNPFAGKLHCSPKMPVDHILRGIIAGIFSSVFGEGVDCVETHCIALGEASCEFIVKKHKEFDFSDSRVRQQLGIRI